MSKKLFHEKFPNTKHVGIAEIIFFCFTMCCFLKKRRVSFLIVGYGSKVWIICLGDAWIMGRTRSMDPHASASETET